MSDALTTCDWEQDQDGYWIAGCGLFFEFADEGPTQNGFNFCPYCGKPLTEQPVRRGGG